MKDHNLFSLTILINVLLFTGCYNPNPGKNNTNSSIEEQVDSIPLTYEKPDTIMEERNVEVPDKKSTENQVQEKKKTKKPVEEPIENQENVEKETVKKTKPAKMVTYDFILENVGKQVADDFKGDLMTMAAEEVYIEKKGKCGNEDCGKKINLVNMNQDKSIEITVGINWKESDKKNSKKRSYKLKESQKLEIGCSSKCDENKTSIKWQIIGAVYSN